MVKMAIKIKCSILYLWILFCKSVFFTHKITKYIWLGAWPLLKHLGIFGNHISGDFCLIMWCPIQRFRPKFTMSVDFRVWPPPIRLGNHGILRVLRKSTLIQCVSVWFLIIIFLWVKHEIMRGGWISPGTEKSNLLPNMPFMYWG